MVERTEAAGSGLLYPSAHSQTMLVWPGRDLGLEDSQVLGLRSGPCWEFFFPFWGKDLSLLSNLGRPLAVLGLTMGQGRAYCVLHEGRC